MVLECGMMKQIIFSFLLLVEVCKGKVHSNNMTAEKIELFLH